MRVAWLILTFLVCINAHGIHDTIEEAILKGKKAVQQVEEKDKQKQQEGTTLTLVLINICLRRMSGHTTIVWSSGP